jgi:outer membrane assembly lipoprotein YfiO
MAADRFNKSSLLLVACVVAGVGCEKQHAEVEFSVNAQIDYERGVEKLHRRDWDAATQYFAFVTSRFPYSKWAWSAELGLADVEFGQGQYLAAMARYKKFIRDNPMHDLVANGYVSFKAGEAYGWAKCQH